MRSRPALTVAVVGLVAAGVLVAAEAAQIVPEGRQAMYRVFVGSLVLAALVGWWLTRMHRRLRSLRWSLLIVAVAATVVATGVVAASTSAMFLDVSELRLVLAALLLGAGLGVLVAASVTRPLTDDLRELARAAQQVAQGDLTASTAIDRRDEVGVVARSLDRMIEQLRRMQSERERDEAARRRLFTAIGHDLRTPLASLQAAIESLQDGFAPDTDRYLRSMGADVALLGSMVEDLFVLVRLEAGETQFERLTVDLAEVADSAVEAIGPLADRHGIEVRLRTDGPAHTRGDPLALHRVLRNLLDNAVRHAPPGTPVQVRVVAEDGTALVEVIDGGPGFPPDFIDRAFDRFTRPDAARERQGGGAGLGLAIAKELVDAHGGTIWIVPGRGATVAFRVPLAGAEPAGVGTNTRY